MNAHKVTKTLRTKLNINFKLPVAQLVAVFSMF